MKKNQYRRFVMKQLAPYFEGVRKWFSANIGLSVLLKIAALLVPVFYAIFVEEVLLAKKPEYLWIVIIGSIVLQVLISVLNICKVTCGYKVNNTVFKRVKIRALQQYFQMESEELSAVKAGDVKMVLEDDVERLSAFGMAQSGDYVLNGIYAGILGILLLCMDWRLSLLSFWLIPVTFLLDHLVSRKEKNVVGRLNTNDGNWGTWLDESIKGWKEIRVNQFAAKRKQEFLQYQQKDERNFSVWLRYWVTRVLVIPKIKDDFVMQFLLYFIGGILIYYRYLTIGVLLVFVRYYGMLSNTVKELSLADASLQSDMICYDRILERIGNTECGAAQGDEIAENSITVQNRAAVQDGMNVQNCGDIQFSEVSFRYREAEQEVIRNLSFRIAAGERVVIRGASGTGKTTLLKLLIGVLRPTSGTIYYAGNLLHRMDKHSFYRKLAYISQDAVVFNDTILENLLLGNSEADMYEVEDACKKAQIYEVIQSLPEGLQTVIGENGSLLSGGQRQRLLLARAFLRDADIYVLDEVTSALDGKLELEIEQALQCIPEEKTVIVVTHRDTFFENCHRQIVL